MKIYLASSNIVATFACNSLIQGTLQYIIQYMEEIWKDIEGYENYQVSNYGRVKSLKFGKERIKNPKKINGGYFQIGLNKNGKTKGHLIHRLVAEAFIPNPDNLPIINHKDEDKTNNHVENLEWCSYKYNSNYGSCQQRRADRLRDINNTKSSKTVYQYSLEDEFIKKWPSTMEIERQLGFSHNKISRCCLGGRPTAYGFKWRYN